ncbi:MAG: hypothetical protein JW781_00195 [Deltaproteobacteria bacterium]|nr:hypothetical protein [Candidatus Anaeroferrophillacea bacterium]
MTKSPSPSLPEQLAATLGLLSRGLFHDPPPVPADDSPLHELCRQVTRLQDRLRPLAAALEALALQRPDPEIEPHTLFAPELLAIQQQIEHPAQHPAPPLRTVGAPAAQAISPTHPLHAVFEHAPYGILDLLRDGTITYGNNLARFLLCSNKGQTLENRNLFELLEEQQAGADNLRRKSPPASCRPL